MSCTEAAFLHINLHRRSIFGVVDAPPMYLTYAKDVSVQSEWAACTISTRVLSVEMSATVDSFGAALAGFVRPLEQDGCTLYFHATTSLALAQLWGTHIDFAAGRGALDFNCSTNGFYLTKLPLQAATKLGDGKVWTHTVSPRVAQSKRVACCRCLPSCRRLNSQVALSPVQPF